MLRDVERIARSRPWLVAGAGTVLGFLAARFTKASKQPPLRGKRGLDERRAFGARSASRLSH